MPRENRPISRRTEITEKRIRCQAGSLNASTTSLRRHKCLRGNRRFAATSDSKFLASELGCSYRSYSRFTDNLVLSQSLPSR